MKIFDALRGKQPENVLPEYFGVDGNQYAFTTLGGSSPSTADGSFMSMVERVHRESSPVSAAVLTRSLLVSQMSFAWGNDRPGPANDLTVSAALDVVQNPGGQTRQNFLMRLEQDVSYGGNAYVVRRKNDKVTRRLDPSRCFLMFSSDSDPLWDAAADAYTVPYDATVRSLVYDASPANRNATREDLEAFFPGEFAHWAPEPDPLHWWRGASWMASLVDDVAIDGQIKDHTKKYFRNAATPNLVMLMEPTKTAAEIQAFADVFNAQFAGVENAGKNWFLGGGTDVKAVGSDMSKLGLKDLQGATETRVAMRSRVPAVILGAREGLSGSSLNTGNYGAARRLLSDGWFAPHVDGLCAALQSLIPPDRVPAGKRLTYDRGAVLFLQEDRSDEAEISQQIASAIRVLVDAGYDPEAAVATLAPQWAGRLSHTGNVSVQLQPAGTVPADNAAPVTNSGRITGTVVGRLSRAESVADIDTDVLTAGLPDDVATAIAECVTIAAMNGDSLDVLRPKLADIVAEMKGE